MKSKTKAIVFSTSAIAFALGCGGLVGDDPHVEDADASDGAPPGDGSFADAILDDAALLDSGAISFDASLTDGSVTGDATACVGPGARFITSIVDHVFGPGQSTNQTTGFPSVLFGPPHAGDGASVVSLGNGGYVIAAFGGNAIIDGPGPDFTVFENPLPAFKELATISVSDDGVTWHDFPCTWQKGDTDYGTCAGVKPVYSTPNNGIDPLDPKVSGGDTFDLAQLGVSRARFVRVVDREDLNGQDGVFDLDAIAILHAACP